MSRSYGKPRRGRVHVDEDELLMDEYGSNINVDIDINADDFNPEDFEVSPEHQVGIATTIDHSEKPGTRKDYRNRLQRMVDWCIEKYPEYAKIATRDVTEEELKDTTKHYYNQKKILFINDLVLNWYWLFFPSCERRMQMVQVRRAHTFMFVNFTMLYCTAHVNRV